MKSAIHQPHAALTLGVVSKFLRARRGVSVIASEEQIDLKNIVIKKREGAYSSADKKEIGVRLIKVAEYKSVVQYADGIKYFVRVAFFFFFSSRVSIGT